MIRTCIELKALRFGTIIWNTADPMGRTGERFYFTKGYLNDWWYCDEDGNRLGKMGPIPSDNIRLPAYFKSHQTEAA